MVHIKARFVGPVLEVMDRYGNWREIRVNRRDGLYVCPKTGQLRRFVPAAGRR